MYVPTFELCCVSGIFILSLLCIMCAQTWLKHNSNVRLCLTFYPTHLFPFLFLLVEENSHVFQVN